MDKRKVKYSLSLVNGSYYWSKNGLHIDFKEVIIKVNIQIYFLAVQTPHKVQYSKTNPFLKRWPLADLQK